MHDGYMFTLGLAAGGDAAVQVLNAALAAVPPVKRAIVAGAVVALKAPHDALHETLLPVVTADLRDSELVVLVSGVTLVGTAPNARRVQHDARLLGLLRQVPPPPADRLRQAVLLAVVSGTGEDMRALNTPARARTAVDVVQRQIMLAPLQQFCMRCGIAVASSALLSAPDGTPTATAYEEANVLARAAHVALQQHYPDAQT